MVEGILDGLRWLGLDWDEGPASAARTGRTSSRERLDRLPRGGRAARRGRPRVLLLLHARGAEGEARGRRGAKAARGATTGPAASLSAAEIAARTSATASRAPCASACRTASRRFDDLVHGPIEFDGAHIEDFVVLRSDGHPTYHLSVVSTMCEMEITHVVRGDDHISNTPKQVLLYRRARCARARVRARAAHPRARQEAPEQAPRRHIGRRVRSAGLPARSDDEFPRAARLVAGRDDQEVFSREELIERVRSLDGISGGNAVFNPEKLDWFNQQHIIAARAGRARARVQPSFAAAGLWDPKRCVGDRHAWFFAVLELLRPRAKRLDEFVDVGRFFFADCSSTTTRPSTKHLRGGGDRRPPAAHSTPHSRHCRRSMSRPPRPRCVTVADATGVKAATLIHAVRVAVTGRTASPGLFEVLALLGRERTRARMAAALRLISVANS